MQAAQGSIGRVFVLRLEDGDTIPGSIETFAKDNDIRSAMCLCVGGAGKGDLVVGPENGNSFPPIPMHFPINDVHEIAAVGTLFPDADGTPVLHMHGALGRGEHTRTGCVRPGLEVWTVGEVVILEINGTNMHRIKDDKTGFALLERKMA